MKCKWKIAKKDKPEFYYLSSCNFGASKIKNETEYYEYCPYCGKEVEIETEEEP